MAKVTPEIIHELKGNVSAIARKVKLARSSVYDQINASPELDAALKDSREELLDNVEAGIFKDATEGNTTAQIFILKTLGKSRGYIERQEITGVDGAPVFNITIGPDEARS